MNRSQSTHSDAQKIIQPLPQQRFAPVLPEEEIRAGLEALSPQIPWCHHFDLGAAGETVTPDAERYYGKAKGLKIIGAQIAASVQYITRRGTVEGLTVLDLASAEGQHSIELAASGASKVVGIEGRKLYVDRSRFIAQCFGLPQIEFREGDVRRVSRAGIGGFELVLFLGILHHLGPDDFVPILRTLKDLTDDTLIVFTHTAEEGADVKFGTRLSEVRVNANGFKGRFYREHADDASAEEKEKRVRSSLDNTFSFWPREAELLRGLREAGFAHISRQLWPSPFQNAAGEFRVFYVCRI